MGSGYQGDSMPKGQRFTETGLLLRDQFGFVLRVDDGGEWRLEPPLFSRIGRFLGLRVTVVGDRWGFDQLHVRRIESA